MYTTKQRILNELSNSDILTNDNNITLRYFQLYLEGNYNNEQEYYNNLEYIKLHKDNYKKMLTFVINKFCNFMHRSLLSMRTRKSFVNINFS